MLKRREENFKSSKATAAILESPEDIESVSVMEGNFGLLDGGFDGEIPQTLDELVDLLGIQEPTGTVESFDTQHFSAFASEDMWPI